MLFRSVTYSEAVVSEILSRLAEGQSMVRICKDPAMPAYGTVMAWIAKDETLQERYARAKFDGLEVLADELLEIADEDVERTPMGTYDSGAVNKQRLQVDTRKWLLSKLAPKKYGDKLQTEVSGGLALQVVSGVTEPGGDLV